MEQAGAIGLGALIGVALGALLAILALPLTLRRAMSTAVNVQVERLGAEVARQEEQTRATVEGLARVVAGSQAWYWSPDWQEGEREADAELAAGRGMVFDSDADFEQYLANRPDRSPAGTAR
jgi:hypothetical protein